MKWIILLSAVLFATACSNDPAKLEIATGSLKVDVKTETGLKATYKRNDAPVFISGVRLDAENTQYVAEENNVSKEFTFEDVNQSNALDIVLEGLKVGKNRITAEGLNKYSADNNHYKIATEAVGENMEEKAEVYAGDLKNLQGIWAHYVSKEDKVVNVSNKVVNETTIEMVTNNHRVGVVLENPSTDYKLKFKVYGEDKVNPLFASSDFVACGTQEAFVINNGDAEGTISYNVVVEYYTKGAEPLLIGTISPSAFTANKLENVTKLYRFVKETLVEGEVKATFTWEQFNDVNSGEDLNDNL